VEQTNDLLIQNYTFPFLVTMLNIDPGSQVLTGILTFSPCNIQLSFPAVPALD